MKKNIETVQGSDVYPAAQQMLIYQGKVLKDDTTLEHNEVAEGSFVVIMLTKVIYYPVFWRRFPAQLRISHFILNGGFYISGVIFII